jgi:Arc/MetJ family transcription regulator
MRDAVKKAPWGSTVPARVGRGSRPSLLRHRGSPASIVRQDQLAGSEFASDALASVHQMRYYRRMRTTIDIDADVLSAAKEIAEHRRTTAGRVISDLARQALTAPGPLELGERGGFFVLPKRAGVVVTSDMVKRLADDEG